MSHGRKRWTSQLTKGKNLSLLHLSVPFSSQHMGWCLLTIWGQFLLSLLNQILISTRNTLTANTRNVLPVVWTSLSTVMLTDEMNHHTTKQESVLETQVVWSSEGRCDATIVLHRPVTYHWTVYAEGYTCRFWISRPTCTLKYTWESQSQEKGILGQNDKDCFVYSISVRTLLVFILSVKRKQSV